VKRGRLFSRGLVEQEAYTDVLQLTPTYAKKGTRLEEFGENREWIKSSLITGGLKKKIGRQ